jgi:GT2 family glycosyltransferase
MLGAVYLGIQAFDMAVALCLIVLVPATIVAAYYLLFTALGQFPIRRLACSSVPHRIAVLIPAHDEEIGLARTLRSLRAATYPSDRLHLGVVADNCNDRTAAVAAQCGADVIVRTDPDRRGKGFALAHGLTHILPRCPDAVLILDADCEVSAGLLRRFDQLLSEGVEAAQAWVSSRNADEGPAGYLAAVGAEIDHAVAVGRERGGWSVPLRGTGMLFRRELLERFPWTATGPTEDAEYARTLVQAGVRVRLVSDECVLCEAPPTTETLCIQRERWRAALRVPGGVPRLFMSKPLVLLQLLAATGTVLFCRPFLPAPLGGVFGIWLGMVGLATVWVYGRAVVRVGMTRSRLISLCRTPALIARLGWIALESLWKRERTWKRTARRPKLPEQSR